MTVSSVKTGYDGISLLAGNAAYEIPARGVFAGGDPLTNTIDYVTITTTGNATDFGDLTQSKQVSSSGASSTRGLFSGGYTGSATNVIEYITPTLVIYLKRVILMQVVLIQLEQ